MERPPARHEQRTHHGGPERLHDRLRHAGARPAPVTTIAWRIGHLVVGVLGARVAAHFAGPAYDYATHDYPGDAAGALAQLDEAYAAWTAGVHGLGADGLTRPCGPTEGPWAEHPMAELILHINREVIHHGAEIALLRNLYRWRHRQAQ